MSVRFTAEAGVGEVVLDRPDKRNALDPAMAAALLAVLDRAEEGGSGRWW